MVTTLILVRHGESEANRSDRFAGHWDVPLLERGLRQAQLTADYIARHYHVTHVYASDLQRAWWTGQCIARQLDCPITAEPQMREISAGEWEGILFSRMAERYPQETAQWLQDVGNARCPGGESVRELGVRVTAAMEDIARRHPGETVVVATHATPIRVAQCLLGGRTLAQMQQVGWVSNASVNEFLYEDGSWKLGAMSVDEHLSALRTVLPDNV